jgi:hypothetical protein
MKIDGKTQPARAGAKGAEAMSAGTLDMIFVAGIILLTAIAYFAGVSPLLERHAQSHRRHDELIGMREELQKAQLTQADVQQQLGFVLRSMSGTPLHLQPAVMLNNRLAALNETAIEAGAGLDDVLPGKNIEGPRFDATAIHLGGRGSFPAFTNLLHRLREDSGDFGITLFDISDVQDPNGTAKFNVELLWYTEPSRHPVKLLDKPDNGGAGNAKGRP